MELWSDQVSLVTRFHTEKVNTVIEYIDLVKLLPSAKFWGCVLYSVTVSAQLK